MLNRDCPVEAICLLDPAGAGACSLPSEECTDTSSCPGGLACVSGRCMNVCASLLDCPPDATCSATPEGHGACMRAVGDAGARDAAATDAADVGTQSDSAQSDAAQSDASSLDSAQLDAVDASRADAARADGGPGSGGFVWRRCNGDPGCGASEICVALDTTTGTGPGYCGRSCTTNADCTGIAPGLRCVDLPYGPVCSIPCDGRTNADCAGGDTCDYAPAADIGGFGIYWWRCRSAGTRADTSCLVGAVANPDLCAVGYTCASDNICRAMCTNPGGLPDSCASMTCRPWLGSSSPMVDGVSMGICTP